MSVTTRYTLMSECSLTASDDEHRLRKGAELVGLASDGEQLTDGYRLASLGRRSQDLGVKVALREEADLHAALVRRSQVPVGVIPEHGGLIGLDEGVSQDEVGDEGAVGREARQDDAIRNARVRGREGVRVHRAEGVADVDDLLERASHPRDGARAELVGQRLEGRDLQPRLDLVDGLAVRGLGDAETVPGEGRVAVVVDGRGDVAVVVLVGGEVPVGPVEADAVGEDLEDLSGAAVWPAVCRG